MERKINSLFPSRQKLIEATFSVIKNCNSSATNSEIEEGIIELLHLPDDIVNIMHTDNTQTKLNYELQWARTYLKNYGAINNSERGVWAISTAFDDVSSVDGNDVVHKVRELKKKTSNLNGDLTGKKGNENILEATQDIDEEPWRAELSQILHNMDPFGFEKLTMRLLRECGFSKVNVTKKSGDNGIDGVGKVNINGLVSINVAFQCKRYAGLISNAQIRDFRGSLPARIEKGIFVTTGSFSNAAIKEAEDPGKTPGIDLIDGEAFISLLLKYQLGVSKEEKTVYIVDKAFFDEFS